MIFVTVGTQLPFDRLVKAVDLWASTHRGAPEVFAQVGNTSVSFPNINSTKFIGHAGFWEKFLAAELIVAHAGMGSIIAALEQSKPLLVMPRKAELGEHRDNHQVSTAKRFAGMGYLQVADNGSELCSFLDNYQDIQSLKKLSNTASAELLKSLRGFVDFPPSTEKKWSKP